MKIYLICPVRKISEPFKENVLNYVKFLQSQNHEVYCPLLNTEQEAGELAICQKNLNNMRRADIVYFTWDGKSESCIFDLGMAFALGREVVAVVGMIPRASSHESFQNLVYALDENRTQLTI